MLGVIKTNPFASYDDWLNTDIIGDIEFKEEYELEWVKSLVRLDVPHMDEDDVEVLAQQRMDTDYYSTLDF